MQKNARQTANPRSSTLIDNQEALCGESALPPSAVFFASSRLGVSTFLPFRFGASLSWFPFCSKFLLFPLEPNVHNQEAKKRPGEQKQPIFLASSRLCVSTFLPFGLRPLSLCSLGSTSVQFGVRWPHRKVPPREVTRPSERPPRTSGFRSPARLPSALRSLHVSPRVASGSLG